MSRVADFEGDKRLLDLDELVAKHKYIMEEPSSDGLIYIDIIALWFASFRNWQAEGPIEAYSTEEWCEHLEDLAEFTDKLNLPVYRIGEMADVELLPGLGHDIKHLMVAHAAEGKATSKFAEFCRSVSLAEAMGKAYDKTKMDYGKI